MYRQIFFSSALLLVVSAASSRAQAPAPPLTAIDILTQALSAAGAANAAGPLQSFTASGTITFFRSAKPVQAPATIRAQGSKQFRLDATLPEGPWSLALNGDSGARKDERGALTRIPLHNTISMGGSPFPYLSMAAALADPTVTVSDLGLVPSGSQQLRHIRIIRTLPKAQDPDGIVKKLSETDYFVDPQTNLVVRTLDFTHPVETLTRAYLREMDLENYKTFDGVAVPTLVRQKIAGQKIWEFNVTSITFNTALTDTDFTLQ